MALDEAIALSVRRHDAPPTLRFYGWDMLSLSLGCFQKSAGLNLAFCRTNGIPVVRRPTGGRAVLHGEELTYSFSVRTDLPPFAKGLFESYRSISTAFIRGFAKLGISAAAKKQKEHGRTLARSPLCFHSTSYGEILIENRKIVGSAQKRWQEGLLQQGSIPYAYDKETMQQVFGIAGSGREHDDMTSLRAVMPEIDDTALKKAVVAAFEEVFGISLPASPPSPEEARFAAELEESKYLRKSWNLRL
jgi:lipoate-protein ligase A